MTKRERERLLDAAAWLVQDGNGMDPGNPHRRHVFGLARSIEIIVRKDEEQTRKIRHGT